MGGWSDGRQAKACLSCISEIMRCKMLILGRDIGFSVSGGAQHLVVTLI